MLREIKLQLQVPGNYKMHQNKSSLFHGALMELINEDYAQIIHVDGVRPYSQSLTFNKSGECYWQIRTLTDEAYSNIGLKVLADEYKTVDIKYDNVSFGILDKTVNQLSNKDLVDKFYNNDSSGLYRIYFESPTAFKVDGVYQFYPDLFHIYQSIMLKYDAINGADSMFDEETLNLLVSNSRIVSYRLHDERFGLEGVKIPCFKGEILVKVHGAQTIKNLARLLLEFGTYSGVGIKTALGMGCIRLEER